MAEENNTPPWERPGVTFEIADGPRIVNDSGTLRNLIDTRLVIPPETRHSSYPVHRVRDGLDASMFEIDDSEMTDIGELRTLHPSVQSWYDYMEAHEGDLHVDSDGEIWRTQFIDGEEPALMGPPSHARLNGEWQLNREVSPPQMWNDTKPILKMDDVPEGLLSTKPKKEEPQKKTDCWDILGL